MSVAACGGGSDDTQPESAKEVAGEPAADEPGPSAADETPVEVAADVPAVDVASDAPDQDIASDAPDEDVASDAPAVEIASNAPAAEVADAPEETKPSALPALTGLETVAPELRQTGRWINSEPFTLEGQRGKVVLIDFWTYTCINCIRTLPYLKAWYEKYADKGLVILGVHTPEFEFEKLYGNVVEAVEGFELEYPIVQDNDFGTWRAFNNRYWPAKYLIDKEGRIRYTHFGEGAYTETEMAIRELLAETDADLSRVSVDTSPDPDRHPAAVVVNDPSVATTRELYAGFERNYGALITKSAPPYVLHNEYYEKENADVMYEDPGVYPNHFILLNGLWRNEEERLVHARETKDYEDYVIVRYYATSVNVVVAPVDSGSFDLRVTVDGEPIEADQAGADVMFDESGNSFVFVDEDRMYRLVDTDDFSGHDLRLSSNSPEFALFAFTFGSYEGGEPDS